MFDFIQIIFFYGKGKVIKWDRRINMKYEISCLEDLKYFWCNYLQKSQLKQKLKKEIARLLYLVIKTVSLVSREKYRKLKKNLDKIMTYLFCHVEWDRNWLFSLSNIDILFIDESFVSLKKFYSFLLKVSYLQLPPICSSSI